MNGQADLQVREFNASQVPRRDPTTETTRMDQGTACTSARTRARSTGLVTIPSTFIAVPAITPSAWRKQRGNRCGPGAAARVDRSSENGFTNGRQIFLANRPAGTRPCDDDGRRQAALNRVRSQFSDGAWRQLGRVLNVNIGPDRHG